MIRVIDPYQNRSNTAWAAGTGGNNDFLDEPDYCLDAGDLPAGSLRAISFCKDRNTYAADYIRRY